MNDDDMLATLRSSLTGVTESLADVRLDRPADAIRARARGRRLRRGLAGAGAGGIALGVGLALASGGAAAGPGARSVHVNLDAWSVNTQPNGLVYVDVRELTDAALLRQTLATAGVPAIVTFGEFCTDSGRGQDNLQPVLGKALAGGEPKLTINPAGIPAGHELSIGIVSADKGGQTGLDTYFALVTEGSHLTCGAPATAPADSKTKPGSGPSGGTGTAKG
jgi:hypothetical protein